MSRRLTLPGLFLLVVALVVIGLIFLISRDAAAAQSGHDTPTPSLSVDNLPTPVPTATPNVLHITVDPSVPVTEFGPHDRFVLNFSQPMNPETVLSALLIEPTMVGQEIWRGDGMQLTFVPEIGFAAATTYTIRLHPDLRLVNGNTMSRALSWTIHTVAGPTALGVNTVEHPVGERRPQMVLTFDQPMKVDSVAAALTISPTFPFSLNTMTRTVTIMPDETLTPGQTYYFTLDQTAVDHNGLALSQPFVWELRMAPTFNEAKNLWDPARGEAVTFHFNYPVDPTSFNLTLTPSLDGTISWNSQQTVFSYTLTARPPGNMNYTFTLPETLLDHQGDALLLTEHTFTMQTAERIYSVKPTANDDPVSLMTPVQISFKIAMDRVTTENAFHITPTVAGEFVWQGNTLEFRPTERLAPETVYTVTIDSTATDSNGDPIQNQDYRSTFRTGEVRPVAGFGEGEHTQVMMVSGRKAIQYSFYYDQNPVPVTFDLYQMNFAGWQSGQNGTAIGQWTDEPQPRSDNYVHVQETFLPADLPGGIYRLTLSAFGQQEDELTFFLSDMALVAKLDTQNLLVWAASLEGQLIVGATIHVYNEQHQLLASAQTGTDGLVMLDRAAFVPAYVTAQVGDSLTLAYLSGGYAHDWRNGEIPEQTGTIYTDRPIYQPNETVYFRGLLRRFENGAFVLPPAGSAAQLQLRNNEGSILHTQPLATNDFGAVNGEFQLGNAAAPGLYTLILTFDGATYHQVIQVQNPVSDDLRLTVTTDAPVYAEGDTITVSARLTDASGQPIADQLVTFQAYWWMDEGGGCWGTSSSRGYWGIPYEQAEWVHRTDENGQISFDRIAESNYTGHHAQPGSNIYHSGWAIAARVTQDEAEISQFTVWEVATAEEVIYLDVSGRFQPVGQSFPIQVKVLDVLGEPVRGRSLLLELLTANDGYYGEETAQQRVNLTTDENGRAVLPLTVYQAGYYTLRVSGTDRFDHSFTQETTLLAYDDDSTESYHAGFHLLAEKPLYAPGETARIAVFSSYSGPALLTVSRENLLNQQVVQLTAPLTFIELPLSDAAAPNLTLALSYWEAQTQAFNTDDYFSYQSLSDGSLHTAYFDLEVRDPARELNVTITPEQESHTPGTTATFTVRVTNGNGEPVSAELSLALVDEAIYQHFAPHTTPISAVFRLLVPDQLMAFHSLNATRDLTWGGGFGGCGCGGGYWLEPTTLSSSFDAAAIWNPSLVTDANGEAAVTVTLPTGSTTWRITVAAATADTQVGSAVLVVGN